MKFHIPAGAVLTIACILSAVSFAATPEEDDAKIRAGIKANLGKATITLLDALKTAVTKVPGSQAVEAGFEVDKDQLFFYVEVILGNKHQDVVIDAKSGMVLAVNVTQDEEAEEKKIEEAALKARINLRQAIEIAQKQVPRGKPYEAIVDKDGAALVYLVSLLINDKFIAVLIDANSGRVLGMEESK